MRETTKATVLEAPGPQLGVGPERPFRVTVRVSSLHDVLLAVLDAEGDTTDVLWAGPIQRAETVSWVPPQGATGPYTLVSASRDGDALVREVRVALTIAPQQTDTLPWPVPPMLQPKGPVVETAPWRPLALGLGLGAAVVVAPLIAGDGAGTPTRFVLATGLSAGGILGFVRARRGAVNAEAVAANVRARAAWHREQQRVGAENARRRSHTLVDIRTGPPLRRELDGQ